MNNTRLRPNEHVASPAPEQHSGTSFAPAARGGNEAVRDFFRRGDRGQYEGGPADQAFDSLPSWDLPERAPIVRTPKQQTRRIAMMWAEAVLMLGCVAFLVTAALKSSNNPSQQSAMSNAEKPILRAAAQTVAPRTAAAKAIEPSAPVVRGAAVNAPAPVQAVQSASPTPAMAELPRTHSVASSTVASERRPVSAAPAYSHPEPQRAKSSRRTQPIPVAKRTEAITATTSLPTNRAVAAFPDD